MTDQITPAPEMLVTLLGETLIEKGLITRAELDQALEFQQILRSQGRILRIGQVLVEMKVLNQQALDTVVYEQILNFKNALQDSNASLEKRVIERTAQLQAALNKVSEMSQIKANFVSNISHELRTPLTHLKGYLDLLINGDLGALAPDQQRALQVMFKASERLNRLIEDLILFSTAERGEFTIQASRVNICTLAKATVNRALPKALEKQILLGCCTPPQPVTVEVDEEKISWVILQLLDNAIKFTPAEGRVTLDISLDDPFVRVAVADTGVGIPKERVDEIFEAFHQLDGSTTRRFGGTGLGLSLARRIIDSHGSSIQVQSEVGKGSQFVFLLKAAGEQKVGV